MPRALKATAKMREIMGTIVPNRLGGNYKRLRKRDNVWQLKEVGGFHRDVFAIKNFLFTTNLSAEHIVANFF
jgi:hypothetical protein